MPLTLTNRDIDVLEQSVQLATTNGEDAYTIPTTTLRALFETRAAFAALGAWWEDPDFQICRR